MRNTPASLRSDPGRNRPGTGGRNASEWVAELSGIRTQSSEDPPLPGNIRAWEVERVIDAGKLRAVKICSALLEDHLWLILDRSFEPKDGLAIYYAEEIPLLKNKTPEELREIHKVKLAFPGCRVIQEGPEKR